MNDEDKRKLDIVKDFYPEELRLLVDWYLGGMLCDHCGRPYTREYIIGITTQTFYGEGTHA